MACISITVAATQLYSFVEIDQTFHLNFTICKFYFNKLELRKKNSKYESQRPFLVTYKATLFLQQ